MLFTDTLVQTAAPKFNKNPHDTQFSGEEMVTLYTYSDHKLNFISTAVYNCECLSE